MGSAAEALEKNLILAERRFMDISNGGKPYDGERIELLMEKLLKAYDILVKYEQRLVQELEQVSISE